MEASSSILLSSEALCFSSKCPSSSISQKSQWNAVDPVADPLMSAPSTSPSMPRTQLPHCFCAPKKAPNNQPLLFIPPRFRLPTDLLASKNRLTSTKSSKASLFVCPFTPVRQEPPSPL